MVGVLLSIGQPHAVVVKIRDEHARHALAALRNIEIVERVVRAAESVGHDLLEELATKIERGREGVIAEAASADAVARFEHDSPQSEFCQLLTRAETAGASANRDDVEIAGIITGARSWRGLAGQGAGPEAGGHRPGGHAMHE